MSAEGITPHKRACRHQAGRLVWRATGYLSTRGAGVFLLPTRRVGVLRSLGSRGNL